MSTAYWCVFIACVLPYVWTIYAKKSKHFDNASPRVYLENITGARQRSYWAALNSFEAIAPFAASVIMAQQNNPAMQGRIDTLALIFIACRIAFGFLYIGNQATLRSLVWMVGLVCVVATFLTAAHVF